MRTIGDLDRLSAGITVGGPPQFQTGSPGLPDLNIDYGFVPIAYRAMAVGDQYSALNNGTIQAADVNTTDGQLATGDYVRHARPAPGLRLGQRRPGGVGQGGGGRGLGVHRHHRARRRHSSTTDTIRQLNYAVDDRRPGSRGGGPPVPADPRPADAAPTP